MNLSETIKLPKITIGLLTYNSASIVRNALDCLIAQDYPNKEILIIDDCSRDNSYEVCMEYQKNHAYITMMRNDTNLGALGNFFKLLDNMTGELFMWACPDDTWEQNFLSKVIEALVLNPKAVASMSGINVNYADVRQEKIIFTDFIKYRLSSLALALSVIRGKDSKGSSLPYNQLIHSVIRTKYLPYIFPRDIALLVVERFMIVLMIFLGGIRCIPEILHTKYECAQTFPERHPEDPYALEMSKPYAGFQSIIRFIRYSFTLNMIGFFGRGSLILVACYELYLRVMRPFLNALAYQVLTYTGIRSMIRLCKKLNKYHLQRRSKYEQSI